MSSVGEADGKFNCLGNKYYGCMAEKRGIGRVVLRLIGASHYGISSEDDFSNQVDMSFDNAKVSSSQSKPSVKGGVSEESPPSTSPAWRDGDPVKFREEEFSELKVKIKDICRDDLAKYYKNPEQLILDTDKELIAKEIAYRTFHKKKVK